jgi:hypothetical protein
MAESDLRDVLPQIDVPTIVLTVRPMSGHRRMLPKPAAPHSNLAPDRYASGDAR